MVNECLGQLVNQITPMEPFHWYDLTNFTPLEKISDFGWRFLTPFLTTVFVNLVYDIFLQLFLTKVIYGCLWGPLFKPNFL